MSTRIKAAIGIGVVAILAVVIWASIARKDKNLVRVTTAKVAKMPLVATVSCNGRVQAKTKVDISSQVMGQIVTLAVREGDLVKKGDLLLQIDKVQYDANAQATQAALDALFAQRDSDRFARDQAERDLERTKKNFEAHIESEQNLQKAQLAVDSAKANAVADERRIEQARANLLANRDSLKKTTIVSPIDGVVTAKPVEQGENAIVGTMNNAGTVLLTVSDMSVVEGEMEVDETDIPHVKLRAEGDAHVRRVPGQEVRRRRHGDRRQPDHEVGARHRLLGRELQGQGPGPEPAVQHPPRLLRLREDRDGPARVGARDPDPGARRRGPGVARARQAGREGRKPSSGAAVAAPVPATAGPAEKKKDVEGVFVVTKAGTVEFKKIKTGSTRTSRPKSSTASPRATRSSRARSRRSASSRSATT